MINAQEGSTIHSEDYEIGFNEGYRTGLDWRSQLDNNHQNMLKKYKQSQRALWLARAMRANERWFVNFHIGKETSKWALVEHKCREKAKEFE